MAGPHPYGEAHRRPYGRLPDRGGPGDAGIFCRTEHILAYNLINPSLYPYFYDLYAFLHSLSHDGISPLVISFTNSGSGSNSIT